MTSYKYYADRPPELTPEVARSEFNKILDALPAAEAAKDAGGWIHAVESWNALRAYIEGERARIHVALAKNCLDPQLESAERFFRENVLPIQEEGDSRLLGALGTTRHKEAIAARFGQYFLDRMAATLKAVAPVNSGLRVQVGELATQYDKTIALGEVEVGGEKMTLTRAVGIAMGSDDAATRREAFCAHRQWYVDHRTEIGDIFSRMVELRDRMGRNLGDPDFVALGYSAMSRTDYGPAEAAEFRRGVREHFVPLLRKLMARQASELGDATLKPWDAGFHPALGIPLGAVPVVGQLDAADRVFSSLSPALAKHFRAMREGGLIDLENRKGKRGGAFCAAYPDEGRVQIVCNSTGQASDVRTLTHEMGHAFQASESQAIELIELQWPTADAAEIHSMGMEYLSLRHIGEFFADAEHARRFSLKRWRSAVENMCYMVVVDEFQHWVYEHPSASTGERDAQWNRIWETYIPGLDFDSVERFRPARWLAQMHIFRIPFYYIDYAIAEAGAMQLAALDAKDHGRAMETYLDLCRIGGTRSVLGIFESAGLRSPFDAGVLADLAADACRQCELA